VVCAQYPFLTAADITLAEQAYLQKYAQLNPDILILILILIYLQFQQDL
jgi:hypothetical protein